MTQDDLSCEEESGTAKHEVPFGEQLTLRSLLIGALGSVVITTSSVYVALRMGALPW